MTWSKALLAPLGRLGPRAARIVAASLLISTGILVVSTSESSGSTGTGGLDLSFGVPPPSPTSTGTGIATAQSSSASNFYPGVLNGITTETVSSGTDVVAAGQYQPSGGTSQMAVVRFLANGVPDSTFGSSNGLVLPFSNATNAASYGEAVVADGSDLAVVGYSGTGGNSLPAVAVVNASGSNIGITSPITPFASSVGGSFNSVAVDPQTGDLIATGVNQSGTAMIVAAFTVGATSISLDTSFCPGGCGTGASSGELIEPFSSFGATAPVSVTTGSVSPGSIAVDTVPTDATYGDITVVGTANAFCSSAVSQQAVVLGLMSNGQPSFGPEVLTQQPSSTQCPPNSLTANAVAQVQTGGWSGPAILISGSEIPLGDRWTQGVGSVIALNTNGSVATSFGSQGVAVDGSHVTNGVAVAAAATVVQANAIVDSIVPGTNSVSAVAIGGPVATSTAGVYQTGTLLLGSTGSPLSGFGSNGLAQSVGCSLEELCGNGLAVQPDGNFLVAGGVDGPSYLGSTKTAAMDQLSVARLIDQSISVSGTPSVTVSSATTVDFSVSLNASGASASASVSYATQGTSGDFTSVSGSVSFPCAPTANYSCPSATTANIPVQVLYPGTANGSLPLTLSGPVNAGLAIASATTAIAYASPSSGNTGNTGSGPVGTPLTTTTLAPVVTTTIAPAPKPAPAPAAGKGYWIVESNGTVIAFGDAPKLGSVTAKQLAGATVVGIAPMSNGTGYLIVSSKGQVFSFGTARSYGSVSSKKLSGTIRAVALQTNDKGYWLASSTGAVYAFGSARSYGSVPTGKISGSANGFARTSNGRGYWVTTTTGAVYHFGNAGSFGQLLGKAHSGSVSGFAPLGNGTGYWMVTTSGTVAAFGKAKSYGSVTAKMKLSGRIVSVTPTPTGKGYWLTSSSGQVFAFGNGKSYGSTRTSSAVGTATT